MFIKVYEKNLRRTVWIRRERIVLFTVYDGDTMIILEGANDQDNRVLAEGDLTAELTGVTQWQ